MKIVHWVALMFHPFWKPPGRMWLPLGSTIWFGAQCLSIKQTNSKPALRLRAHKMNANRPNDRLILFFVRPKYVANGCKSTCNHCDQKISADWEKEIYTENLLHPTCWQKSWLWLEANQKYVNYLINVLMKTYQNSVDMANQTEMLGLVPSTPTIPPMETTLFESTTRDQRSECDNS